MLNDENPHQVLDVILGTLIGGLCNVFPIACVRTVVRAIAESDQFWRVTEYAIRHSHSAETIAECNAEFVRLTPPEKKPC